MTEPATAYDSICILLVDDNPRLYACGGGERTLLDGFAADHDDDAVAEPVPQLPPEYRPYFRVIWLATIEECREFRNLTWALGKYNPTALATHGHLPEILALDYSLSQERAPVVDRLRKWFEGAPKVLNDLLPLSPLRPLRELVRQLGVPTDVVLDSRGQFLKGDTVPPTVLNAAEKRGTKDTAVEAKDKEPSDYWGCFVGALLLSDLADYPCAPVTITRYRSEELQQAAPDVWILEWLMAMQTGGMLCAQGIVPSWKDIIPKGVDALRTRIQQLATLGLITLDLHEVARLASGNDQPVMTVSSRYGTKRLPTAGVFIDDPGKAREWAAGLLRQLVSPGKWETFIAAESHADELLRKYDQEELVWERIELSGLLRYKEKGVAFDHKRLTTLASSFNARIEEGKNGKGEVRITGEIQEDPLVADIRHLNLDDWTRKWTALIVILKLLQRFCICWQKGMPFEEITLPEVYLALCPVARNPIILPFSNGSGRSIKADMQDVDRKVGFSVKEVLSGRGLSPADRTLLKHVATTIGIGRDLWKEFPRVGKIVEGEVGNA